MDQERFQQIQGVFKVALGLDPGAREEYLQTTCRDDSGLRHEVERLLASHGEAGEFLETKTVTWRPDPLIGAVLDGRYEIDRELGRGGFSVVYLARDNHLHGRQVVIKVLQERIEGTEWLEKKFRQECEALVRISHPGVVGVLDQGATAHGHGFLVMEYVEGVPLRCMMKSGGMDFGRIASLIRQLGQALAAAHEHGVYHRDLKPENILVRNLGDGKQQAVIIDFGVATVKDSQYSGSSDTRIAGSVPYMAPEQLAGKPEAASDIYALGVIAHEMITGNKPFEQRSPVALFVEQQQGLKVRPRELRAGLSEAAETAISRALAYQPAGRYASVTEFTEALAAALDEDGTKLPAPGWRFRARFAWLAVAVLVLFSLAFVWYRVTPSGPPKRVLSYYIQVQKYHDGKAVDAPFRLSGELLFPAGYRMRLVVSSPQKGHLYLLNEAPVTRDGLPTFISLFPSPGAYQGSSFLEAGREVAMPSPDRYFVLDEQQGEEKLWLVWSREAVAEMETLRRWVNPEDKGLVKDAAQAAQVRDYLRKHVSQPIEDKKDDSCKCTLLRTSADPLVHLLRLEHH